MSETTERPANIVVDNATELELWHCFGQICGRMILKREVEALFACIQMWPEGSVSTVLFDSRLKVETSWSWTNFKTKTGGSVFGPRVTISRI